MPSHGWAADGCWPALALGWPGGMAAPWHSGLPCVGLGYPAASCWPQPWAWCLLPSLPLDWPGLLFLPFPILFSCACTRFTLASLLRFGPPLPPQTGPSRFSSLPGGRCLLPACLSCSSADGPFFRLLFCLPWSWPLLPPPSRRPRLFGRCAGLDWPPFCGLWSLSFASGLWPGRQRRLCLLGVRVAS